MDCGTLRGSRTPALWLRRAKPASANAIAQFLLVTPARVERATYGLGNRRSIHLSYGALR